MPTNSSKSRVTAAYAEVDIGAGADAKRRTTGAYAEVDITAGSSAKRRLTAVWVEVDIGYKDAIAGRRELLGVGI